MSKEWNPKPYQEEAIEFAMKRDGCGLMLDPGMGKTSITLACIDILPQRGRDSLQDPRCCPAARVPWRRVWPVEARKWINFHGVKVLNLTEHPTKFRAALLRDDHHVYVINPEIAGQAGSTHAAQRLRHLLVLDESTKFKDTQTQHALQGVEEGPAQLQAAHDPDGYSSTQWARRPVPARCMSLTSGASRWASTSCALPHGVHAAAPRGRLQLAYQPWGTGPRIYGRVADYA